MAYDSNPCSQGWLHFPDGLSQRANCQMPMLRRISSISPCFWPARPVALSAMLPQLEVIMKVMLEQVLKGVLWSTSWNCPTSAHHRATSRASCWHSFLTFGLPSGHPFSPGGLAAFQACWWICSFKVLVGNPHELTQEAGCDVCGTGL